MGELGAISEGSDGPRTFMNNIGTGEGPDASDQFETDPRTRLMRTRAAGGRTLVRDTCGARDVSVCCAHFSGSAKQYLNWAWMRENLALRGGA